MMILMMMMMMMMIMMMMIMMMKMMMMFFCVGWEALHKQPHRALKKQPLDDIGGSFMLASILMIKMMMIMVVMQRVSVDYDDEYDDDGER